MNINYRLRCLDISKGIGIILMVIGHSSLPNIIQDYIYSFHMPLFFIISGMLTNWYKYDFKKFFANKVSNLLFPFIFYSFIVLCLMRHLGRLNNIKDFIVEGWNGYALWFVPVLFFSLIGAYFSISVSSSKIKLYFMMSSLLIIGYLLDDLGIKLAWNMSSVPYATFLILFGSELKKTVFPHILIKFTIFKYILYIIIFFFVSFYISLNYRLDMASNSVTPILPITVAAILGSLLIIMISLVIDKRCVFIGNILSKIGMETYVVLAFSQVIILYLNINVSFNYPFCKYVILIIVLILITNVKNYIKKFI